MAACRVATLADVMAITKKSIATRNRRLV